MRLVPICSGLVSSTSQQPLPWFLIFPARKHLGDQLLEWGGRWRECSGKFSHWGWSRREREMAQGQCVWLLDMCSWKSISEVSIWGRPRTPSWLPGGWRERDQRSRSPTPSSLTPSSATPQLCDLGQAASSLWSFLGYFTLYLLLLATLISTVICV